MKIICTISSMLLLLSGCATLADIKDIMNPKFSGEMLLQLPSESLRLVPDTCVPGSRNYLEYFRGFDFTASKEHWRIRATTDQVQITSDMNNEKRVDVVRAADCTTFTLSAETTRWRVNHHPAYSVRLDLKCAVTNKIQLEGHIEAKHCY